MTDVIKEIISKLPYWFNARHDNNNGNTYKFLSIFGETIYKLEQCIHDVFNLTSLNTFSNIDHLARKIIFDNNIDIKSVVINKLVCVHAIDNSEFVSYIRNNILSYYYDDERFILYISGANKDDNIYVNGSICNHSEHRIWKADLLDEFGLIFSMPRLDNEDNVSYRDRLVEYSRTISNSTFHGISSSIGHSTGQCHIIEWNNGAESISISDDKKICRHIYVDDIPYYDVIKINDNTLSLIGDISYLNKSRKIKYFTGFDLYNLSAVDISSPENSYIFDKISRLCPIMWGIARWGDIEFLDNNVDDYYYIAPKFDPDLSKLQR